MTSEAENIAAALAYWRPIWKAKQVQLQGHSTKLIMIDDAMWPRAPKGRYAPPASEPYQPRVIDRCERTDIRGVPLKRELKSTDADGNETYWYVCDGNPAIERRNVLTNQFMKRLREDKAADQTRTPRTHKRHMADNAARKTARRSRNINRG